MTTLTDILLAAALLAASLALHEWAHVFAAQFMGAGVERTGFLPSTMARVRRLERLRAGERYAIFAAGSSANFALAAMAFSISRLSYVGVAWLDALAFFSAIVGVFNLTPALPLDGGRILWQFLGNRLGIMRASRILMRVGLATAFVFMAGGAAGAFFFPPSVMLVLAGIYLLKKNREIAPQLSAAFHLAIEGKNLPARARTLEVRELPLPDDAPIQRAFERITADGFTIFVTGGRRIHEKSLLSHIFSRGINGTLQEIICYTKFNEKLS